MKIGIILPAVRSIDPEEKRERNSRQNSEKQKSKPDRSEIQTVADAAVEPLLKLMEIETTPLSTGQYTDEGERAQLQKHIHFVA